MCVRGCFDVGFSDDGSMVLGVKGGEKEIERGAESERVCASGIEGVRE
jgi:hypothetical protein